MGGVEGSVLGAVDADGAGDGRSALVTLTVTPVSSSPFVTAGTPSRPAHSLPPSTTPALATYVSVGSITPWSTAIENGIDDPVGDGMTWRATIVPVVESTRAATATADDVSVAFEGIVMVPVTAPASAGGLFVATRVMPLVGPPVMTGTGSKVWYTVEPSMIDPNSA